MLTLYPPLHPYRQEKLSVDPLHQLYLEQSGNPDGLPVLLVHGGPGAGCSPELRRFFDPRHYRIILFDQRGAGRSTPHAELTDNTTPLLIADMERIRQHLNIDQWVLFGGSWGSTLSLAYAQAYPERTMGLILRGIFLCRQQDLDWLYRDGANRVFPEYWQDFVTHIPSAERDDLLKAFYLRLIGSDEVSRMAAAKAWCLWEGRCSSLHLNPDFQHQFDDAHTALSMARIETHFFMNQGFMAPNQLLEQAGKLAEIPGTIVHGRYDMVCPLDNALALHALWPQADLKIIRDAGHSSMEAGIVDALVSATREMSQKLLPSLQGF